MYAMLVLAALQQGDYHLQTWDTQPATKPTKLYINQGRIQEFVKGGAWARLTG